MKYIDFNGKQFEISFPYNQSIVGGVKGLPGRRFVPETKCWRVPVSGAFWVLKFAELYGFTVSEAAAELLPQPDPEVQVDPGQFDIEFPCGYKPFEHQKTGALFLLSKRRAILADDMGLGKAQPNSANVLTPAGWQHMGALRVGDFVIGANGQPTRIKGVYPQGEKEIFEVQFSDEAKTLCCDDHLWEVNTPVRKRRNNPSRVLPLREIRKHLTDAAGNSRHYIPMVKPVEFSPTHQPLHPYLLGLLLGDGGLTSGVKFSTADQELLGRLSELLPPPCSVKLESKYNYRISVGNCGGGKDSNPLLSALRKLGLCVKSHAKFIPHEYLFAPSSQRIALLQGLLDTDGSVDKTGHVVEYSSVSIALAHQVTFLVRSLGGTVTERKRQTSYTHKGVKQSRTSWRLRISLPSPIIPFRLTRKVARYIPKTKYQPTRAFRSVKSLGKAECTCIAVEDPRQLYVTDDCILTHNTATALLAAMQTKCPVHVLAPAGLVINWKREAAMWGIKLAGVHSWAKVPHEIPQPYTLIADEAHYAQAGHASQRGASFLSLADKAQFVFMLTGTPIKNGRPVNLLPLLTASRHTLAANMSEYHLHFCDAKKTPWSNWDTSGAKNLDELHERTKDVIMRRMKSECLDLPPKTRVVRQIEPTKKAQDLYDERFGELQNRYRTRVEEGEILDGSDALVMLMHLRQAASIAKVDAALELAQEAIEEQGSVVVFTFFQESAEQIAAKLGVPAFTGSMSTDLRQKTLDLFQSGASRAFVGTIGAGGIGITLTQAQTVIMVDRPWTPGDTEQAEDRLHRIGQSGNVLSVWLQFGDSDELIDEIIQKKAERIELVLQGKRKTMRATGSIEDVAVSVLETMFKD